MSAIFDKILDWILRTFTGLNLIVAIIALLAIAVYWLLSGKKKEERPAFIRRLVPVFGIILIAVLIIGVQELFVPPSPFPKGTTGILVARIEGDADNGIQRDLVSTLNTELRKDADLKHVHAKPFPQVITEARGHDHARKIGKKCNAKLVIWGSRGSDVRERIIHPRITVIPENYVRSEIASQHLDAQIVSEIKMPPVLVAHPIFLIHFVLAQSYFRDYKFEQAMNEFEKCLKQPQNDIIDESIIRFWFARTLQDLGKYRGATEYLEKSIKHYQNLFELWSDWGSPVLYSTILNNLGTAYVNLPTGNRIENLNYAIGCFKLALQVHNAQDSPVDWARVQINLGVAYSELPASSQGKNLKRAIECYQSALRVFTEQDFPFQWALIQNNLGTVSTKLPTRNRIDNLKHAIAYFELALRIYNKKDFPVDWARTQYNLGAAYTDLPSQDRIKNLKRAKAYYEQALRVYKEQNFPVDWALTQNNLGTVYSYLSEVNDTGYIDRAIDCFEQALNVYTEKKFPVAWAETQINLGNAYNDLIKGDPDENIKRAISYYELAFNVYTEKDFPLDWAFTNGYLGMAYFKLQTGSRKENLKQVIQYFKDALKVWNNDDFPIPFDDMHETLKAIENEYASLKD